MNDTAFLLCPELEGGGRKKKIDLPTLLIFRPKGQTNLFIFLGLISHHERDALEVINETKAITSHTKLTSVLQIHLKIT